MRTTNAKPSFDQLQHEQLRALAAALRQLVDVCESALSEIARDSIGCELNQFGIVQGMGNQVDRLTAEFIATRNLREMLDGIDLPM